MSGRRRCTIAALAATALLAATGTALRAQLARPPGSIRVGAPIPEARADVIAGGETSWHLGAGVTWPVGRSLRLGVVAAGGVTDGLSRDVDPDGRAASGRAEAVARFMVGSATERRWRMYGGAGAGALFVRGARGVARVHLLVGAEGAPIGRPRPALELGLGGGVRVAVAVRGAR